MTSSHINTGNDFSAHNPKPDLNPNFNPNSNLNPNLNPSPILSLTKPKLCSIFELIELENEKKIEKKTRPVGGIESATYDRQLFCITFLLPAHR